MIPDPNQAGNQSTFLAKHIADFPDQYRRLVMNNAFVVVAAGVAIGMLTKETVSSIMDEVIQPVLGYVVDRNIGVVLYKLSTRNKSTFPPTVVKAVRRLGHVVWKAISWVASLYVVFAVFSYFTHIDLLSYPVDMYMRGKQYVRRDPGDMIAFSRMANLPALREDTRLRRPHFSSSQI